MIRFFKANEILMPVGGAIAIIVGIIAVFGIPSLAYVTYGIESFTGLFYTQDILTPVSADVR